MGAANKVPGVSGGVVAFVAGFYEEFIYSLQKINGKALKLLINRGFSSFFQYINGRFLVLLILGMVFSYFSVSKVLDYLIQRHELFVWASFFGMIIGSIHYIGKDFKHWNSKIIVSVVVGTLAGLSISLLNPAKENDNLLFVFLCGIISVTGMTLPGFSGSFILILVGNYVLLMVDSVNALYDTFADIFTGDLGFIHNESRMKYLRILAVFTAGSLTGMVTFSNVVSYLLKRFREITMAVILGFIVGSLGVVWPWKRTIYKTNNIGEFQLDSRGMRIVEKYERYWPDFALLDTWVALVFIVLGIAIVLWLGWYGKKTKRA